MAGGDERDRRDGAADGGGGQRAAAEHDTRVSLRTPPTADAEAVLAECAKRLLADPPYGARAEVTASSRLGLERHRSHRG
jgi:hypothetical protein